MNNINTIKEKLTKLLRLGENEAATEGEIANAFTLASRLMAQHNLTRDDIDTSTNTPAATITYGRHWSYSKGKSATNGELLLASFVCEFLGTVSRYRAAGEIVRKNGIALDGGRTADGICFYGPDADCQVAVTLFEECRDAALFAALIRYGHCIRGAGAAYAEGFAQGIYDANRVAKAALTQGDSQTSALMVIAEKNELAIRNDSREWLETTHGIHLIRGRRAKSHNSHAAYSEGRWEGAHYTVTRPGTVGRLTS